MASDNELQIVLTLIDNASKRLKEVTQGIKEDTAGVTEETKKLGKETDKTHKSMGENLKNSGKALKDFRRELFVVTASITAITMVSKAWAENNIQARETLDSIGVSINKSMGALGSILTPIIELTDKALKGITKLLEFSAMGWAGIVGLFKGGFAGAEEAINKFNAQLTNRGNLQEMNNQMKLMNDELARMDLMFMTGKLTAEQYYATLTSGTAAAYQGNQLYMQLSKQMAAEENLLRNQSLLDYRTDIDSRMGLLKTLQSYHHTVYSSMMDFSNMFIQQFSSGMTSALTAVIMGTKRAGEAFKEFGIAMVTSTVEFVIQYGIQMAIAAALSNIIMASTIGQASAIAAAWLPAAMWASIATLGAADAAGASGFAASSAAMMGTAALSKVVDLGTIEVIKKRASGGWVGLNGPEVALVGEQGPEYVVPNHKLGNMGNQTSIHIEVNNPQVRSDEDIDKLTYEISQKLAREAERL